METALNSRMPFSSADDLDGDVTRARSSPSR